jgi:hypothetical protein
VPWLIWFLLIVFDVNVDFSKTHFGIPSGLTVYPKVSSLEFPIQMRVKAFSGRVCSKALILAGTQVRDWTMWSDG